MALKATIFKASLSVTDMDRHYYDSHALTIARHPSENDERMMLRLLAFALCAHERLSFTKGLSTDDQPELWQIGLDGHVEHWVELGLPSEKRIRQACSKADQVTLLTYGGRSFPPWWKKIQGKLTRYQNLRVVNISPQDSEQLAQFSERNMEIHATIQDGDIFLSVNDQSLTIHPEILLRQEQEIKR